MTTLIVLSSISILLHLIIVFILLFNDSEERKLSKVVNIKSLKLKEKAIDMQMANTAGFLEELRQARGQETEQDEEPRQPVGYARRD